MKIGIFTDDFYPFIGGIGRHIYDLYYTNDKLDKIVFSPGDEVLDNHVIISSLYHRKLKNLSFSYKINQNINSLIKQYSLDIINIHCGPGGIFLLKKPICPVVATCHHTYWQQSHYIKSQFWKKIFIPFEKKTFRIADKIIAVSEDSKRILVDKYKIESEKISVIPNGVDNNKFYKIEGLKKIPKSILYIGRIDKRKGVDFLIKAMQQVIKKDCEVKLFVGGKGKDLNNLKKYINKNKMDKNIEFLGFVPDNILNEWYNKVSCVIVPSVFEGFGITVIESIAAGTVVIGTNVDGIRTIIKDKENGYLVPYGNIKQLSNVILNFITNNKDAINNVIIENKYLISTIQNKILEFYDMVGRNK